LVSYTYTYRLILKTTKENKFFESIKTGPVACRSGTGMICSWAPVANHQPTGVSGLVMPSKNFYLVCPFFYIRTCISIEMHVTAQQKKRFPSVRNRSGVYIRFSDAKIVN
jgi:hypothetical protein